MTDCTKMKCCNTCKNSRIQYSSPMRDCVVDNNPYERYFGGHSPDYVCEKYEPTDWFIAKGEKTEGRVADEG